MKQYLDLMNQVITQGSFKENRTGVPTYWLPGMSMKFNMQDGFPAMTTRKLAFKSAIGEMIGFFRTYKSAADFRALGCRVWDQNANENAQWLANPHRMGEDDLGEIYGIQWRKWPAFKEIPCSRTVEVERAIENGFDIIAESIDVDGNANYILYKAVDQVKQCLDLIMNDPDSRRIIFHGWNVAELDTQCLNACHFSYQWHADKTSKELSLTLYIRSNDLGLGASFNAASGAAMLTLFARLTGYTPKWFTYFIGDAHVYVNHLDMINEQSSREPYPLPTLKISDRVPSYSKTGIYEPEWLEKIEPSDFILEGYKHHPAITAPMAV